MLGIIKNGTRLKIFLGFIVAFSLILGFSWIVIDYKQKEVTGNVSALYKEKGELVFKYVDVKYSEAEKNAKKYSGLIKENLLEAYGNDVDLLMQDLKDLHSGKQKSVLAMVVISNTIRGVTLNDVPKQWADNNDLIIFLADLIIGDLSLNCATNAETRTIKDEAFGTKDRKPQFVPLLGQNAMFDITKFGVTRTFWHFLDLKTSSKYYDVIKNFTTPNLDELKELFIKNGADLNFLKGYEFLAVASIENDSDITGNKVLLPNGARDKNVLQLHVVQGFNLLNQIELDPEFKYVLQDEDNKIAVYKKQLDVFNLLDNMFVYFIFCTFIALIVHIDKELVRIHNINGQSEVEKNTKD